MTDEDRAKFHRHVDSAMSPVNYLTCCCCGNETLGRQWWNRDTGYGLCNRCFKINGITEKTTYHEYFGQRGIHWDIPDQDKIASTEEPSTRRNRNPNATVRQKQRRVGNAVARSRFANAAKLMVTGATLTADVKW